MQWLGIAVFHGIPVYLVALLTESKRIAAIAAVVMAAIAVAFGSPAYSVVDLIAVFVGYFLGTAKIDALHKKATARALVKKEIVPNSMVATRDSERKRAQEVPRERPAPKPQISSDVPDRLQATTEPKIESRPKLPSIYKDVVEGSTIATVHWVKGEHPTALVGNTESVVKLPSHQLLRDATLAVFDPGNPANYVFIRFRGGNQTSWRGTFDPSGPIGFGWVDGHEVEVISAKDYFVGDGTPCLRLNRTDHADGCTETREGSAALAQTLREWHSTAFCGASVEEHSEAEWAYGGAASPYRHVDAREFYRKKRMGAEIARTSGGAHAVDFMIVGCGIYEATLHEVMKLDRHTYAFFDTERLGRHAFYRRIESEDDHYQSGSVEYFVGFGWVDNVEAIVTCRIGLDGLPYLSWQRGNHRDNTLISENDRFDADKTYFEWTSLMFVFSPFGMH